MPSCEITTAVLSARELEVKATHQGKGEREGECCEVMTDWHWWLWSIKAITVFTLWVRTPAATASASSYQRMGSAGSSRKPALSVFWSGPLRMGGFSFWVRFVFREEGKQRNMTWGAVMQSDWRIQWRVERIFWGQERYLLINQVHKGALSKPLCMCAVHYLESQGYEQQASYK